jgi:hypothetical protein
MTEQARPADLTAFLRALELSAEREDGIGVEVDEIALVESAPRAKARPRRDWVVS